MRIIKKLKEYNDYIPLSLVGSSSIARSSTICGRAGVSIASTRSPRSAAVATSAVAASIARGCACSSRNA